MWNKWQRVNLWKKNLAALFLGILFGLIFTNHVGFLHLIGNTFINLLKMMVMPLVFVTLIHSIINLTHTDKLASLAAKTIFLFLLTSIISIIIAIIGAVFVQPGSGVHIDFHKYTNANTITSNIPSIFETLLNIIPSNPFKAFTDGNVLQVVFLSLFVGIVLSKLKVDKTTVVNFISIANDTIYSMIHFIIQLMPFGIFALLAYSASIMGYELLIKLSVFVTLVCTLCFFQAVVVFSIILKISGNSISEFIKGAYQAILASFLLSSSSAAVPVSMECAKTLNIDETTRSLIIPLGSIINMNGTAIQQVVITIFVAQIVGMELYLHHYLIITLTTLVATIGAAGVPSAGLIMTSVVLNALGLPVEGIAIVAGVDRIIDMVTSSLNVTGDLVIAKALSDKKEKKKDFQEVVAN